LNATFTSGTDSRGGIGLETAHTNNFVVEGNIVANSEVKDIGLELSGPHDGHKNTTVRNNIVYGAGIPLGTCCYEADYNYTDKTVFVHDNVFERRYLDATNDKNRVVQMKHSTDDYSAHFVFRDNRYWDVFPDAWFYIGKFNKAMTFDDWLAHVDDVGSVNETTSFVDPDRGIESYHVFLGEDASSDSFFAIAKEQSAFNWNSNYTAHEINEYIREGFQKA